MGTVEVTATAMAAGGDALAREQSGRVVFVEGALPGERVVAELTVEKKDFAKGRVVEVLDASPSRVGPMDECGACQWAHIDVGAQAAFKRDVVIDGLRRIAHVDAAVVAPDVVQVAAGRTTVRMAVTPDGRAGFRRRHSHDVVTAAEHRCPIVHPGLAALAADGRFDGCDEVTLRMGVGADERLVIGDPTADGVVVPDDVIVVPVDEPFAAVHEDVAGRRWQVSALSFFQPSPEAAEALVAAVAEAAGEAFVVVDAYAGVGLLGGSLVAAGGRVVAIESSPWAAADAQVNLADLDAVVIEGEVAAFDAVPDERPDVVIADPARPGLGPGAAAALAGLGAPRLVLVSCDPASFARDVGLLAQHGYGLASTQVLDLFPHTFHVEVVSRFEALRR
jgi:23S rRNA (uracil1939-C5)-methyltransferase